MKGVALRQLDQDGAPDGGLLRWSAALGEWVSTDTSGLASVKTYTWFQDTAKPYIEFKGLNWTVQDRIRFAGTNKRTPVAIDIVCEVDGAKTGNFRIVDPINGVVVEKLNIQEYSWALVDLGSLSNLSATKVMWEIQVMTSGAQDNMRISSMDIEF